MKKGYLQKFLDKKFDGKSWQAANEMVVLFCEKYHIAGSAHGYDLYTLIQEAWKKALEEEKESIEKWENQF